MEWFELLPQTSCKLKSKQVMLWKATMWMFFVRCVVSAQQLGMDDERATGAVQRRIIQCCPECFLLTRGNTFCTPTSFSPALSVLSSTTAQYNISDKKSKKIKNLLTQFLNVKGHRAEASCSYTQLYPNLRGWAGVRPWLTWGPWEPFTTWISWETLESGWSISSW